MNRTRKILLAVALTALALVGTAGTVGAGTTQPTGAWRIARPAQIPAEIRVPEKHKPIATLPALGAQTYRCENNEWTFLQPDAILTVNQVPLVLHSAGPVWTSVRDGSSVTGAVMKSSPVPQAVTAAVAALGRQPRRGTTRRGHLHSAAAYPGRARADCFLLRRPDRVSALPGGLPVLDRRQVIPQGLQRGNHCLNRSMVASLLPAWGYGI